MGQCGMPADTPRGYPNCGVCAVAMGAKVSYWEAEETLRNIQGYVRRGNWKGRTSPQEQVRSLVNLGAKVKQVSVKRQALKNVVPKLSPSGTYLVITGGHAQIVKNGCVFDQVYQQGMPIEHTNRLKNKIVKGVVRVYGKSKNPGYFLANGERKY